MWRIGSEMGIGGLDRGQGGRQGLLRLIGRGEGAVGPGAVDGTQSAASARVCLEASRVRVNRAVVGRNSGRL